MTTTKAAPAAAAEAASAASSARGRRGWGAAAQECLVSHQLQPTPQPARRMKKALRPAWIPSPWREWKVSTTGRCGDGPAKDGDIERECQEGADAGAAAGGLIISDGEIKSWAMRLELGRATGL